MTVSIGERRVVDHAVRVAELGRVNECFDVFELEQASDTRRLFLTLREIPGVLRESVATLR